MIERLIITTLTLLGTAITTQAKNPVELGKVEWIRDINQAVVTAKKEKKPILVLFQEVPG